MFYKKTKRLLNLNKVRIKVIEKSRSYYGDEVSPEKCEARGKPRPVWMWFFLSERPLRDPQFDTSWKADLGLIQSRAFILYQMVEPPNTVSIISPPPLPIHSQDFLWPAARVKELSSPVDGGLLLFREIRNNVHMFQTKTFVWFFYQLHKICYF